MPVMDIKGMKIRRKSKMPSIDKMFPAFMKWCACQHYLPKNMPRVSNILGLNEGFYQ
jgi:hypothetical protein